VRHFLSLVIIAFSVSALLGGFFSGRAAVPHLAAAPTPLPQGMLSSEFMRQAAPLDEVAHDQFARDAAVALAPAGEDFRNDARLALVLVDAGRSLALESPFVSLNVPVTFVIDPQGSEAHAIAQLAQQRGDAVYVQVRELPGAAQLGALRRLFPGMSGVAMRLTQTPRAAGMAPLRIADLRFFDEYGELDGASTAFASAGVRYTARGITVDDHAQRTYVAYMLRQAVHLARTRVAVVIARPFPGTFQAFQALLARAPRDGVRIVGLP
jgi:polysaccharide deacetylase 2 family uncharacterized protein YibQ